MKLDETMMMTLPRTVAEQIILGLYDPINEHLVELIGFECSPELRQHFRRELRSWLRKIERLRFKPAFAQRRGRARPDTGVVQR